MLKEFRDFLLTGNVVDFAVAVIMAGAVALVVNGFVSDIVMPLVGEVTGGMNFEDQKYVLTPASGVEGEEGFTPENAIRYGAWIGTIINLVIVGFVMFGIVKSYNRVRKPQEEVAGPSQEELLAEIRDLLKKD